MPVWKLNSSLLSSRISALYLHVIWRFHFPRLNSWSVAASISISELLVALPFPPLTQRLPFSCSATLPLHPYSQHYSSSATHLCYLENVPLLFSSHFSSPPPFSSPHFSPPLLVSLLLSSPLLTSPLFSSPYVLSSPPFSASLSLFTGNQIYQLYLVSEHEEHLWKCVNSFISRELIFFPRLSFSDIIADWQKWEN